MLLGEIALAQAR